MSEPLDTEMPEIREKTNFFWEVVLPDGKLLENPAAKSEENKTTFYGYQAAENAAVAWWIIKMTRQFNPKVTKQP